MSLKKKLSSIGARLDKNLAEAAKVFKEGEKTAYGLASRVEQDLSNKKTVIGGLAETVQRTTRTVSEKAKEAHSSIKSRGGYQKVIDQRFDALTQRFDTLAQRVEKYLASVDAAIADNLYTDGEFDDVKANAFIDKRIEATRAYGEKFVRGVSTALTNARETFVKDYRSFVPTANELNTAYAEIGAKYNGLLLRPDYEACLTFYKKAEKTLPAVRQYRIAILNDIKASAAADKTELLAFYETIKDEKTKRKAKIASELLK